MEMGTDNNYFVLAVLFLIILGGAFAVLMYFLVGNPVGILTIKLSREGVPIPDQPVLLIRNNTIVNVSLTDKNGICEFKNLTGRYSVYVSPNVFLKFKDGTKTYVFDTYLYDVTFSKKGRHITKTIDLKKEGFSKNERQK